MNQQGSQFGLDPATPGEMHAGGHGKVGEIAGTAASGTPCKDVSDHGWCRMVNTHGRSCATSQ